MLKGLRISAERQQRLADFSVGAGIVRILPQHRLIVGDGVEGHLLEIISPQRGQIVRVARQDLIA